VLLPVVDWKGLWNAGGPRKAFIGLATTFVLSGVGTAGYYLWPEPAPKPPPPADSTLVQGAEYAAGTDFTRLPMDRRLAWIETQIKMATEMSEEEFINIWKLMGDEKRNLIQKHLDAVARERVRRQVSQYYRLPPKEKTAYLDQCLDEFEKIDNRISRAMESTDEFTQLSSEEKRRKIQEQENRDFTRESARLMLGEPADQRAKTVTFVAALGKRQTERHIKDILSGKGARRRR